MSHMGMAGQAALILAADSGKNAIGKAYLDDIIKLYSFPPRLAETKDGEAKAQLEGERFAHQGILLNFDGAPLFVKNYNFQLPGLDDHQISMHRVGVCRAILKWILTPKAFVDAHILLLLEKIKDDSLRKSYQQWLSQKMDTVRQAILDNVCEIAGFTDYFRDQLGLYNQPEGVQEAPNDISDLKAALLNFIPAANESPLIDKFPNTLKGFNLEVAALREHVKLQEKIQENTIRMAELNSVKEITDPTKAIRQKIIDRMEKSTRKIQENYQHYSKLANLASLPELGDFKPEYKGESKSCVSNTLQVQKLRVPLPKGVLAGILKNKRGPVHSSPKTPAPQQEPKVSPSQRYTLKG